MKNLMLVLAGLAVTGSAYAADVDWKHAGEIRVRHTNTTNSTVIEKDAKLASNENMWEQRTKVSLTAMKGESFTGHVTLLNAQTWGRDFANSPTAPTVNANDGASSISQSNGKNAVIVHESYIWWKNSDMMSWRIGRGGFTMADGSVVSKNEYEQIPTVFDGVLGSFDLGFMGLNVFGVKGAELGTGDSGLPYQLAYDRESNFYGVSVDLKNMPDMIKMANIHLIKEIKDPMNTTTALATLNSSDDLRGLYVGRDYLRYGATVGGDYMNFDYKLTYAGLTGKNRWFRNGTTGDAKDYDFNVEANMIDFAVGYAMPDMMNFHVGATYHQDSGDKDGARSVGSEASSSNTLNGDKKSDRYDPFHYDKHKYAAETGVIGWGNLTAIGLGAEITPLEATTFGLKYLIYSRTSDKDTPNSTITHTANSDATAIGTGRNTEKALGTEWSLTANHKYNEAFDIGFRYSMFDPGAYFKKTYAAAAANDADVKRDALSQWWLQAALKF